MNQRLFLAIAIVVVVMVAGTALLLISQEPAQKASGHTTFIARSGNAVNYVQKLQLRLSVNATYSGGQAGNTTVQIKLDEFNTLQSTFNRVQIASPTGWGLTGLSLSQCGDGIYPFGIALYSGDYIVGNSSEAGNLTAATPLPIFPNTSCTAGTYAVTGYVFNPASNLAVILPNSSNSSAILIGSNLTATTVYRSGVSTSPSAISLGPGTYTVAAGDEWGSVVAVHFTIGESSGTSSAGVVPQFAALSATLGLLPVAAMSRRGLLGSMLGRAADAP